MRLVYENLLFSLKTENIFKIVYNPLSLLLFNHESQYGSYIANYLSYYPYFQIFYNILYKMKKFHNYLYNYSDLLGEGNFSKVYKGQHQLTNEHVAIKIVELSSLTSAKLEELLNSEIQILRKMDHPNVLKCYEALSSKRNCYIVTELCEQGDLRTLLSRKKYFQQQEIFKIVIDILEALKYLKSNSIIHRDVKMCNIFIKDGNAKLADFGFAKIAKCNFTDASIGSPIYMSPQGFIKNNYGPKTDIWALGIILFQLTHGHTPSYQCKTETQLKQSIAKQLKQQDLHHKLSRQYKNLVLHCLQIDQQKRASIEQLDNNSWVLNARRQINKKGAKYFKQLSIQIHQRSILDLKVQQTSNKKPQLKISTKNQYFEPHLPQNFQKYTSIFRPSENFIKLTNNTSSIKNKQMQSTSINHKIMSNIDRKKQQETSFQKKSHETMNIKLQQYATKRVNQQKKKSWTEHSTQKINCSVMMPFSPPSRLVNHKPIKFTKNQDNNSLYTTFNPKTLQLLSDFKNQQNNIIGNTSQYSYKSKQNLGQIDNIATTNSIDKSEQQLLPGQIEINQCIGLLHYCRLLFKFTLLLKQYQVKSSIKPNQSPISSLKNKTLNASSSRTSLHLSIRNLKEQQKKKAEKIFAEWVMMVLSEVYKKIVKKIARQNIKNAKECKTKTVIAEYLNKYSKELGVPCIDAEKKIYKYNLNLTHEDVKKEIDKRINSIDHEIQILNVSRVQNKTNQQLQNLLMLGYYVLTVELYTQKLAQCQVKENDKSSIQCNQQKLKENPFFKNFRCVDDIQEILQIKKKSSKLTVESYKAYYHRLKPEKIIYQPEKENKSILKEFLSIKYTNKLKTEDSNALINAKLVNTSTYSNKSSYDYHSKLLGLR